MPSYLHAIQNQWIDRSFRKRGYVRLEQPMVSFTFDDAPGSAFEWGGKILSRYGYHGTFYIALSFLEHQDPAQCFTVPQLQDALAAHHELGCHTFSHIPLGKTPVAEGMADVAHNQAHLQSLLPGITFQNFAYPFGSQGRSIKQRLGQRFRSLRGIQSGVNRQAIDLNNLKTIRLYEQHYSLEQITHVLDAVTAHPGWLIFYTHDVCRNPSPYGCSPEYFEAVVKQCVDRKFRGLTVNEALNYLSNNITI